MIGVLRLESQMIPGNGKFERTGIGTEREARKSSNTAFNFLKPIRKPVLGFTAVMVEISISGIMIKVDELANYLQVCLDSGTKKVLLPITSATDIGTVPSELVGCIQIIF
jgi:ATP-dependent Lon protease